MEQTELERVAEAILFAAGEPVELERIAMAAECDPDEAEQAVRSLMASCDWGMNEAIRLPCRSSMRVTKIASVCTP